MSLTTLFSRHAFFSDNLDAFVDGELRGAELTRFQAHLGRCERCSRAVAEAQVLKSSFQAAPRRAVPRSFALTPDMLAEAPPRRSQNSSSPRILGLARVAAAVSVVAFLSVFVVSALNHSNEASNTTASPLSERNSVPAAAEDSAGGAAAPATSQASSGYSAATPTVVLVPATSGGVTGAGVASATPSTSQPVQQVAPLPSTDSSSNKSAASPVSAALGDAASPEPDAAREKDSGGGFPWVIAFGCLAGAAVGVLLVVESRHRRRS